MDGNDQFKGNNKAHQNLTRLSGNVSEYLNRVPEVAFKIVSKLDRLDVYNPVDMYAVLMYQIWSPVIKESDRKKKALEVLGDQSIDIDLLQEKYLDFSRMTHESSIVNLQHYNSDWHCQNYIDEVLKVALAKGMIGPQSPNWSMVQAWFRMDRDRRHGFKDEDIKRNNDFLDGYIKHLAVNGEYNLFNNILDPKKDPQYWMDIGYVVDNALTESEKDRAHTTIANSISSTDLGNTISTVGLENDPNPRLDESNNIDKKHQEQTGPEKT